MPLRKYLAEKHGVSPEHVVVTNGSMQADAFLFDELVSPGTQVVVEKPSYDRTLLGLKERGAEITAIPLEDDGIDVAACAPRSRAACARVRAHHPELPEPRRLLALAREAPGARSALAEE